MDKDKDKDKDAGSWRRKKQLSGWNFYQIKTLNAGIKYIIKYICTN